MTVIKTGRVFSDVEMSWKVTLKSTMIPWPRLNGCTNTRGVDMPPKKFTYDKHEYNFSEIISQLFDVEDLSMVHEEWSSAKEYELLDNVKTDQLTVYHKHFYDNVEKFDWYETYNKFVKTVIAEFFDEPMLYQKIPTFRVHQPDNLAVAGYHRDMDYNHSEHEVNFFLPMTKAFGSNTIWVESEMDKRDFAPMEADNGEFYMWNGAILLHGNKVNKTGKSRVSVDFRVLPESKYVESDKKSVTYNVKFSIGDYFERM